MNKIRNTLYTNKCYVFFLFAVVLLLGGFMYLFSSCEREENNGGETPALPTGEMVAVNFAVSEAVFGEDKMAIRNGASSDILERCAFSSPLGGVRGGVHYSYCRQC